MIALARREFHLFQAAGRDFLYLVPSAAVFALDDATSAVLRVVSESTLSEDGVVQALANRFDAQAVRAAIAELVDVRDTTKPLRGRAHLLVTVPLYMAWFQSGGSQ